MQKAKVPTKDAVAKRCKGQCRGHIYSLKAVRRFGDYAVLFLRLKIVLVRLLSRGFFSEVSFLTERPDRTERESDTVEPSSMYLSL